MKTLALIFAALGMLADAYTTHRSLQRSNREANPILRWLLGSRPQLWVAIAWRAAVFLVLVLWVPMPAWGWFVFGALFYAVAARNAGLVDRSY